jgi:hypothetical protein
VLVPSVAPPSVAPPSVLPPAVLPPSLSLSPVLPSLVLAESLLWSFSDLLSQATMVSRRAVSESTARDIMMAAP